MKPILVIALLWLQAFTATALAQKQEAPLPDALKGWQTVRIVCVMVGGDYAPPAPYILLQRLNPEHVVLSTGKQDSDISFVPVVCAILTNEAAQKLIERVTAFYAQAKREIGTRARVSALPEAERLEVYRHYGFGIDAAYIRIEVFSHGRNFEYEDDFDDGESTITDFSDFIANPQAATK